MHNESFPEDQYRQETHVPEWIASALLDDLSDEEKVELDSWLAASDENKRLYEGFLDKEQRSKILEERARPDMEAVWGKLEERLIDEKPRSRKIPLWRYAAACLLALVGSSALYYFYSEKETITPETLVASQGIDPALADVAYLFTADGARIDLSKDTVFSESGIRLSNQDQRLSYDVNAAPEQRKETSGPAMNRLVTPRGGTYTIVLPDGSEVKLNAGTELQYPNEFTGDKRIVYLEGEAYFDVVPGKKAFIVKTSGVEVCVLGTSFNVMAYRDEKTIQTTLVQGKVEVAFAPEANDPPRKVSLTPDMQAVYDKEAAGVTTAKVDVYKYIAWKEGMFAFDNERLEDLFRSLERWYDIDVVFESEKARNVRYTIDIKRFTSVEHILKFFKEDTDVALQMDGRTLRITDKN